jgi:glycosyltransferase involved in cell wall biosynthesis
MKRVLAIAPYPYLPYFSGGQKLIARFLHHLAERTELTVVSVPDNDPSQAGPYRLLPLMKKGFRRYLDATLPEKLIRLIREQQADTLLIEHPYLHWVAKRVRKATGVRYVLHTHNIEYQRFKSLGRWWWPILRWYEKRAFREADRILFITPEDRDFAIRHWGIAPEKCLDFPAGVETGSYPSDRPACRQWLVEQHRLHPDHTLLLFNGLLRYGPNLEALKIILDQIVPRLHEKGFPFTLLVCGKDLPADMNELQAYRERGVVYAGFVDNIETYLKGCDTLLNPVQSGGGIKTKMVEAIAFGCRVVATRTGATGIHAASCGDMLSVVEDGDWSSFTAAVTQHKSPAETPAAYYAYYYWPRIIERLLG